ncbi:MAG TPA: FmdB family zinc ribbon protein [Candidatus Elarobacter sp.]|nr:FmdB family zinc ribbon protein [Candidatus Elarobacter sp.]
MPLYDYQCRTCSKVSEVRHGFREAHQGACPDCGGELARVFNPAGIVFKGSGFYITDSRKASGGNASGDGGSKSEGSSKSSDTAAKSDSSSKSDGGSKSSDGGSKSSDSGSKPSDGGSKKSESSAA